MKLADRIRFNIQKGSAYSVALHIFLAVIFSLNFQLTAGGRKEKALISIDVFSQEEVKGSDQGQDNADPNKVANNQPSTPVANSDGVGAAAGAAEPAAKQVRREGGDPNGEKILWICGIATPDPVERENFQGPWRRECVVPPEEYFKGWQITRTVIMSAVMGKGTILYNGVKQYERTVSSADCVKADMENVREPIEFGKKYEVEIPECDLQGCAQSKCWTHIAYYGKSEGRETPLVNNWTKKMQANPHGPVYLLEPALDAQRDVANAPLSPPKNTVCKSPNGDTRSCSRLVSPGAAYVAYINGAKCEDFGGYTSLDLCNENHKPFGCEGSHLGNEGQHLLCWKGLGPAANLGKVPALKLWRNLGWLPESKNCEDLGGYASQKACDANAQNRLPCVNEEFSSGILCWRHTGEPINKDQSPAYIVWKKIGMGK